MTSWVKVGAKCRIVDHSPGDLFTDNELDPNGVYEVVSVWQSTSHLYIQVSGPKVNTAACIRTESWMRANRFRPIVDERDDIAAFLAIANKGKLDVMAETLDEAWRVSEEV